MLKRVLTSTKLQTFSTFSQTRGYAPLVRLPALLGNNGQNQLMMTYQISKRNFLPIFPSRSTKRTLPGQGYKKKTEAEIADEDNKSVVLKWINKQKQEQERAKSFGSKVPDLRFYLRLMWKYFLFAAILGLTLQEFLEFIEALEIFESARDKPEFIAHQSVQKSRNETAGTFESIFISLYEALPLRFLSRVWGRMMDVELPHFLLVPLLKQYCKFFNVNMADAVIEDVSGYKSVGQFFRRPLKPELRPISAQSDLVSPADGKVLIFGEVKGGKLDKVKQLSYSLPKFLGPLAFRPDAVTKSLDGKYTGLNPPEEYQKLLLKNPENKLYYCVIYLSPADCHRFFSPVEWNIKHRRHFPGQLLSVSPDVVKKVPELFSINERVILSGEWKHGFFSMAPVGATNVGSIKIYEDILLLTNRQQWKKNSYYDYIYGEQGFLFDKGEELGEFNMGSSIVLLFEAPPNSEFELKSGQAIKYGEPVISYLPIVNEKVS